MPENRLTRERPLELRPKGRTLWAGVFCGAMLAFAAPNRGFSQPYTFATIAGLAAQEATVQTAADGSNSGARFYSPYRCALDNAGNLYVSDGNSIRRVSLVGTNWVVTTLAGTGLDHGTMNGSNGIAQFNYPQGVAVYAAGSLYVADTYNNAIRKVMAVGTNWVVTTLAGLAGAPNGTNDGTNGSARFNMPYGVAVDSHTNLYVADTLNDTIRKVMAVGTNWVVTTIAGTALSGGALDGTNSSALFDSPAAIAVDTNGNLYVSDSGNNTIRKIDQIGTNWVVSTLAGQAGTSGAADGTNSAARFNGPFGIAVDAFTNLYVSDGNNNTIRRIRPVGTNWVVSTLAGSPQVSGATDGTGSAALFNVPDGIAVDQSGNLYVCDSANYTIRQGHIAALMQLTVSPGGVVLSWPTGLAGYACEMSSNFAAGPWTLHTNGVSLSGDNLVQTNTLQAGSVFYRLHKP